MIPIVDALDSAVPLQGMLGYFNFAEGRPDPRVQKQFGEAYAFLAGKDARPWRLLAQCLQARLGTLHQGEAAAFRDIDQARAVLDLAFQQVVPAYREYHSDLLAHLEDADFFSPFFLIRVIEAVLAQRGPWHETQRIVEGTLAHLNDYVGHRPVAVVVNRRRGEVYDHEKVRPIPLYLKGAGVAWGDYEAVVKQALEVLATISPELARDAYFDLDLLDELAMDPRAYDFGHPVDKRPNYCFGEWDPHHIDTRGNFRRFVLRQVTVDGLLMRVDEETSKVPLAERLFDAGAVLAGIILMASAVSGSGPGTHDSSTTLSNLIPRVARVRDTYYAQLLKRQSGPRAQRLAAEAQLTRQPFGGTRQVLNHYLARHRALQMQQRRLALFLAELGYPHAARRQVADIAVPAVRMLTEMHVRLTTGALLAERGKLDEVAELLPQIEDLLQRGIACGAVVDPWNILGHNGNYQRFNALEDSIHDPRVEELIHVMDRLFHLYSQVLSEGAAGEAFARSRELVRSMRKLAEWWDRFATTTVNDIPHVNGSEAVASAEHVAGALSRWREKGEADLAFWKQHLEGFRSPKSFALVIEALLGKEDFRAALGLLMAWLGQAEEVPLVDGDYSFHNLALRWMMGVCAWSGAGEEKTITPATIDLVARFFDHLEANAEEYWQVPSVNPLGIRDENEAGKMPGEEEDDSPYGAAYEGMTYKDSTDDGVEGEILDIMPQKDFDLATEEPRLEKRLQFLSTLARLWNIATRILRHAPDDQRPRTEEYFLQWLQQASANFLGLQGLLDSLHEHDIPRPSGSFESMVEFEQRRHIKEYLLNLAIATDLDQALAMGALRGLVDDEDNATEKPAWQPLVLAMERSLIRKEPEPVRVMLGRFLEEFRQEPLLYTPLSHGGHPRQVLQATQAQTILRGLVANLPRQGLIQETLTILQAALAMEHNQPLAGHRISEFDRLFQIGCQAVIEAVIDSALAAEVEPERVIVLLQSLFDPYVKLWIDHSKVLRLSVVEAVGDNEWLPMGRFIHRYGRELFTPRFMSEANLRGILHRGVPAYLDYIVEEQDPIKPMQLVEELGQKISKEDAGRHLQYILQILVDNYNHYTDYKATATQSDYGENLYQLIEFLRLKTKYERQSWELRPLNLMHEVLARRLPEVADLWRRQVEHLTHDWAEEFLRDLAQLEKQYGLRLTTIRDRLEERFVQPLAIDSLCALVEPAFDQAADQDLEDDRPIPLEEKLEPFAEHPTGVGFTIPPWLTRLESELQRLEVHRTALVNLAETLFQVPVVVVPFATLEDTFPPEPEPPAES